MDGAERIAAERQRQIGAEGYTLAHDNQHVHGELASMAAKYALPHHWREWCSTPLWIVKEWSFRPSPDDRIKELTKAGALIAAEIDRLASVVDAFLAANGGE